MRIWLPTPAEATILVIEDNAGVIALFRRYLGGYRATLIAASGSKQAIALAAKLHPQVIVLDVMMPHEDGWEILQRLKKSHITGRIPVIVCSVLNEPELALSMGASGYITKPVTQTDFLQALQNHLGPLLQASQSEGV
jgi:CheY-like chemotaxis protein